VEWLQARLDSLHSLVESTWDSKASTYRYRDIDTHKSLPNFEIFYFDQPGNYTLKKSLKGSRRLQIHILGSSEVTHPVQITIYGTGLKGAVSESILPNQFFWQDGAALATTKNAFKSIKKIEVHGLVEGEQGKITSFDFTQEDLSLLLPLWAGIPNTKRAKVLIERNLLNRYLQSYGLSIAPKNDNNQGCQEQDKVSLPWNHFIIEGMLAYGYRKEAAMVFNRLMDAILPVLRDSGAFRAIYSATGGNPSGEANSINGLVPLGLFLKLIGIRQIGKNDAILDGNNPFPWPVTVKYQGMTITCHSKDVVVSFSTGHTVTVNGSGPHRVSLASFEQAKESEKGEQTNE